MKEQYSRPELEVIELGAQDIVVTSDGDNDISGAGSDPFDD